MAFSAVRGLGRKIKDRFMKKEDETPQETKKKVKDMKSSLKQGADVLKKLESYSKKMVTEARALKQFYLTIDESFAEYATMEFDDPKFKEKEKEVSQMLAAQTQKAESIMGCYNHIKDEYQLFLKNIEASSK